MYRSSGMMAQHSPPNGAGMNGRTAKKKREKMSKLKPKALLEILSFLDFQSLQNARCSSRLPCQLIDQHLATMTHAYLEMVQIREVDERYHCRCVPRSGPIRSKTEDTLESALQWIVPMLSGARIRLLSFQNLHLNDQAVYILSAMRPLIIQQLSMVGVSLMDVTPKLFHQLFEAALHAQAYSFNAMHHVHSAHFSDELIESAAFMKAQSLEIDVYDFQLISLPCVSIFDRAVIEWFFNGGGANETKELRILSCNRLKLGPYFVAELVKQFCDETAPKPTSLILCGRVIQCRRAFEQMVDQYKNGMEIVQARNERTGEVLRIQLLLTEKIEISRSFEEVRRHGRVRPVGQSARAVFV